MTDIDAKVNMSLDEIIKMEKKKKKNKPVITNGKGGAKRIRSGSARGHEGFKGRGTKIGNQTSGPAWRNQRYQTVVHSGFIKKRYVKPGNLTRSRSNLSLNRNIQKNAPKGGYIVRRGFGGKFGTYRSKNQINLKFLGVQQGKGSFMKNRSFLKRINSLSSLKDPNSVYNRLGYQSPAQIAYRNRVKRAKLLLLQRENQRMTLTNEFRISPMGKSLTALQKRALERRQQMLTTPRRFAPDGLHSELISRAQRRAQYEQKLLRMNSNRINSDFDIDYISALGENYPPGRRRSLSLSQSQASISTNNFRQLPRGRSPFRQNMQNENMMNPLQMFNRQRSRSRSRSRIQSNAKKLVVSFTNKSQNTDASFHADDHAFSDVMYSLHGTDGCEVLGVTGQTLNSRFSS
ncbi:uncharacterized protein LOC105700407 [Orussus abietinus]|uniref:uncharacterized protein LOC105700407 n=1 Tax=Orussus abietinus TaxID=222816 RepID=UPI000626A5D7|nr:uncharacterized protein LOC105700407 [Orussus abietinus]